MATDDFEFEEMSKVQSKLSVEVFGPSGSGKTTALIKLAMGIRDMLYPNVPLKDICLFVDTEKGSATKAVGRSVGGETLESMQYYKFLPPYDIVKYAKLVNFAERKGIKILITDSLTHFWSGEEGILDRVAALDVELGEKKKMYGAWSEKEIVAKKNLLKAIVINANMHILIGTRAKTEYVIEVNKYGKNAPKAIGLTENMQGDMRFEFDVVFSLNQEDHTANIVKDRIGFDEMRQVTNPDSPITVEDGKMLAKIVSEGLSPEEVEDRRKQYIIKYLLNEKSTKATRIAELESTLKTELTSELLAKMNITNLVKLFEYVKN
jgi:hypothetical protein